MKNDRLLAFSNRLQAIPWKALPAWVAGDRLRILMYHSISENRNDPHAIPPVEFRRQMRSLQAFRVISLEEGLRLLRDGRPLKKTWIITFDDALMDFYTTALPILKEFSYPSTMFAPVGLVGTNSIWDSYDKTKPLMTWGQLEVCQKWKVTFGSHTVNHIRLTDCNEETLKEEVRNSLQTLKIRLECVVPALAYPGGFHDVRVHQAAQNAGYSCGLIADSRWGNGLESDFFQLRREKVRPGNISSRNLGNFLS